VVRIAVAVLVLVATVAHAEPSLESPAGVMIDRATGSELYGQNADEVRPIASMTKIFAAMVLRKRKLDLEAWTEISSVDARAAQGGVPSQLMRGQEFNNLDLLHAMLLISDNRTPTALARSVGMSPEQLLEAINALAGELGLAHTKFVDVTGILGNESTAREMAIAFRAALKDPVLARIMRTQYAHIVSKAEVVSVEYRSTVQALWDRRYKVRAGKTGHTDGAGYCMMIAAEADKKRSVVMVFLGGKTRRARLDDAWALVHWLKERD
jgi:D-alanyl-D-alanine endopeptidase (penicillin-binding protein 7)